MLDVNVSPGSAKLNELLSFRVEYHHPMLNKSERWKRILWICICPG